MFKQIDLFIGGSMNPNISENYRETAIQLGKKINERDYNIVFDGCYGLPFLAFNELDNKTRAAMFWSDGNRIPDIIGPLTHAYKDQATVTKMFIEYSDACIFMKGTSGTVSEIVYAIDTKKNNVHYNPIVILNINHEWDILVDLLNTFHLDNLYYVTDNVIDALNYIEKSLYDEDSYFYSTWVKNGYLERTKPIIETPKKLVKEK